MPLLAAVGHGRHLVWKVEGLDGEMAGILTDCVEQYQIAEKSAKQFNIFGKFC